MESRKIGTTIGPGEKTLLVFPRKHVGTQVRKEKIETILDHGIHENIFLLGPERHEPRQVQGLKETLITDEDFPPTG